MSFGFFPDNAIRYFVSYYDINKPEAYVPHSDLFIEKTRPSMTRLINCVTLLAALFERRDVIVVASVLYLWTGKSNGYELMLSLRPGMEKDRDTIIRKLVDIQFTRNDISLRRNNFQGARRYSGNISLGFVKQGHPAEFFGLVNSAHHQH